MVAYRASRADLSLDLPAGRYQLMGSKPRYVDASFGARRPGRLGRPFELADGQTIRNVALALAPAGVITGRVVDETGDVVPGEELQDVYGAQYGLLRWIVEGDGIGMFIGRAFSERQVRP